MGTFRSISSIKTVWLGMLVCGALAAASCREAQPASAPELAAPEPTAVLAKAQEAGGGPGKIAFVSHRDGNPEIYAMNADGSS